MRILILSQYYAPEPIAKPVDLAQALRLCGDDVSVVTGFPNYPSGVLYPGYRLGLVQRAVLNGVPVVRTYEFPYHGKRFLGRFINYVSFMLSAPIGALFAPKVDALYAWHPPLTIGIASWLIAHMRGIPVLYDVQDLWPESVVLAGLLKPGLIVRMLSMLERFVYRQADHLIVVTEGARSSVIARGVPPEKVSVMPHWIDTTPFLSLDPTTRQSVRAKHNWDGRFVLLFAGNLGIVQGLDTILRAADLLRARPEMLFVFVGDGADKARLQELTKSLALGATVQFVDRQPAERMPAYMAAADALIVHLKASPLSKYVIPTKTPSYIASGTPIIMAMEGAAARLVEEAGAGRTVQPGDPAALASAIRELAGLSAEERTAMARRGPAYVSQHLSMDVVIPQYRALLEKIVRNARNVPARRSAD